MKNINIPTSYTLETTRFILRLPSIDDIPRIFSATRYEGFNDGMLWEPPKEEAELVEPLNNNINAWESGEGFSFSIVKKENSKLLGRLSIRQLDEEDVWDVGFWTHPDSQGQGVMTESLAAVIKFGFEKLSATKIEACHAIWNKASEKVLKANGLTFAKYIEKGFQKRGEWIDENLLVLTKEDWENQ